ncbi:MAG: cell division protein FtsL [Oleispira antarctica]|uniref:Cell division protein FtsL n=1 Tax=Oleispira antarctica RB-8 TaxID=698738 RepID=R4YQH0_OLEAN|nr:cell division protein FtsL [Oleispira antarctica]MBQ0792655.1 cell division protein FtsL [Oleispira antarctica]CCK77190.1 Cell division protein FtsL precusor, putative [Oleispira antarctica RB-8]|tara:strand:- start:2613 stop:2891 length:279 start_codon:yes stop_codon:yes gene_type:complete
MMPEAKQNSLIVLAWLVVIVCATLQVAATHWHRQLVSDWQVSEHKRLGLEQDYGRLLLEQSALTAHGRVERIAKDKLNMIEALDVQVIRSGR